SRTVAGRPASRRGASPAVSASVRRPPDEGEGTFVTDTIGAETDARSAPRSGALTSMRLPELQALAGELGLRGTSGMRKSDLIAAIREHRGDKPRERATSATSEQRTASAGRASGGTTTSTDAATRGDEAVPAEKSSAGTATSTTGTERPA